MGIIERILCRLFRYQDIFRDGTNDLYLRRWFIYPRYKEFKKLEPRIYLHKFYRGDEDPHLHDHPWKFTSLILTRGYWEEVFSKDSPDNVEPYTQIFTSGTDGEVRVRTFYPRFSILKRPADWKHRVILKDKKPVWTIVKTGIKERSWGFWIKGKLCPWKQYDNGVCWCEEKTQ
jgi:hypothetical protein